MGKTMYVIEMARGSYHDHTQEVLGIVETKEDADRAVSEHMQALAAGSEHLKNPKVASAALHDAANAHVYAYEVEVGVVPQPPVLGYVAYLKGKSLAGSTWDDKIKTAFFDVKSGEDVTSGLMFSERPPLDVIKKAVAEPTAAHSYDAKVYQIVKNGRIEEYEVLMYLSLDYNAVLKASGRA